MFEDDGDGSELMGSVVGIGKRVESESDADRAALFDLYRAERGGLLWYLRSQGVAEHEAEDAIQAAFVRLLRATVPIRQPGAWLRTVALNEYRRSNPGVPGSRRRAVVVPMAPAELPDRGASDATDTVWAHDAIARLPDKQRRVMAAHVEGRSHDQIAGDLGLTNASVRQNLRRARRALTQQLRDTTDD